MSPESLPLAIAIVAYLAWTAVRALAQRARRDVAEADEPPRLEVLARTGPPDVRPMPRRTAPPPPDVVLAPTRPTRPRAARARAPTSRAARSRWLRDAVVLREVLGPPRGLDASLPAAPRAPRPQTPPQRPPSVSRPTR
jgi:hypothetical protein